jgi:hypothetical protein
MADEGEGNIGRINFGSNQVAPEEAQHFEHCAEGLGVSGEGQLIHDRLPQKKSQAIDPRRVDARQGRVTPVARKRKRF